MMSAAEVTGGFRAALGREIGVVVAQPSRERAHVGIDAILRKGNAGEKGLGPYEEIPGESTWAPRWRGGHWSTGTRRARGRGLVSQVVTQRTAHHQGRREISEGVSRPPRPAAADRRRGPQRSTGRWRRRIGRGTGVRARAPRRARWPLPWFHTSGPEPQGNDGLTAARPTVIQRRYVSAPMPIRRETGWTGAYVLALFGDARQGGMHPHRTATKECSPSYFRRPGPCDGPRRGRDRDDGDRDAGGGAAGPRLRGRVVCRATTSAGRRPRSADERTVVVVTARGRGRALAQAG